MKYTAINIGPIIKTLGMARKPRELWAASYLFSYLMKCIYLKAEKENITIISPAKPDQEKNKIGIYPDRIFMKGDTKVEDLLSSAKQTFCKTLKIKDYRFEQYFNLMSASIDSDKELESDKESTAIGLLNQQLDVLELCDYSSDRDSTDAIRHLVSKTNNSKLFEMESGNKDEFPFEVNTLAEIATAELREISQKTWDEIKTSARDKERKAERQREEERKQIESGNSELISTDEEDNTQNSIDLDEDSFYADISKANVFKGKYKSHHKYFCVVQADGDNVGKTVTHTDLENGQVKSISNALVHFGQKATEMIETYGGLPIYAGGDDLLFIAPVIGKDHSNIFNFIKRIEEEAFKDVVNAVAKCGPDGKGIYKDNEKIEASLSFGISISYYKYPLYEAFESARHLLFDVAKDSERFPAKKAVAWSFRKHSGGTFDVAFSLKDAELQTKFHKLVEAITDGDMVSAVAHKMRENDYLVKRVLASKDENRLDALFDKVLEFQDNEYFKAVKSIMPIFYENVGEKDFITMLYSLLRTAKFIKGEEVRDE